MNENYPLNESILVEIKKLIGIAEADDSFETDIIIHINTFLRRLNQLGVGKRNFRVVDKSQKWSEFLTEDQETFDQVKDYIYIRCKLIFDPPQNSSGVKAMEDAYKELEWLLNADSESALLMEELSEVY